MELIYYRGLTCHLASIFTLANSLGANYLDAYATLWSETDFTDDAEYDIYTSKNIFIGLQAIGIVTEMLDFHEMKTSESLARIPDGALFLVGMDTFYVPWHPVFSYFHGPHFFPAQKETADSFLCFDPVYNEKNIKMNPNDILTSAFELSLVHKIDANPPKNGLMQEARAVLRRHPEARKKLLAKTLMCRGEGKNNMIPLVKQISAMINNRYLFQRFLHNDPSISGCQERFFNESFLLKWEAARNGLYKASIVKDNKSVIDEVHGFLAELMRDEITMAKEILAIGLMAREPGRACQPEVSL